MIPYAPEDIVALFEVPGKLLAMEPYGQGHIHETFLGTYEGSNETTRLIHQRVNTAVFQQPEALMENMVRVTQHLAQKLAKSPYGQMRALDIVSACDGRAFAYDRDGAFWRTMKFIEGARTIERCTSSGIARAAGEAFGGFLKLVSDLSGPKLHDTIPRFHDGLMRTEALHRAIQEDPFGRSSLCEREIAFAMKRESLMSDLQEMRECGALPERITHNDTKINNLLFDMRGDEAICVIDLDTAMPGLAAFDFGDMVRTMTSPTDEDTQDLEDVGLRLELFQGLAEGYLKGAGGILSRRERETLVLGGKFMTLMIGIRFLTDFLMGDPYFRTHREGQNLDRCRTQFKLLETIEVHESELRILIENCFRSD